MSIERLATCNDETARSKLQQELTQVQQLRALLETERKERELAEKVSYVSKLS